MCLKGQSWDTEFRVGDYIVYNSDYDDNEKINNSNYYKNYHLCGRPLQYLISSLQKPWEISNLQKKIGSLKS